MKKEDKKITNNDIDPICACLSDCENSLDVILSNKSKLTKHEYRMIEGIYSALTSVERSYVGRSTLKKPENK